jgi:hypothetical protein
MPSAKSSPALQHFKHLKQSGREDAPFPPEKGLDVQDCTWMRSRKGNLWRRFWEFTLTVFPRRGRWAWCIAGPKVVRFSPASYRTEEAAARAVMQEVDSVLALAR